MKLIHLVFIIELAFGNLSEQLSYSQVSDFEAAYLENYPDNLDCRNRTWQEDGGDLVVMSWHIHYTTNTTDMPRFQAEFIDHFLELFPPAIEEPKWQPSKLCCPFGPNFASDAYPYVCLLEAARNNPGGISCQDLLKEIDGDFPFDVPEASFFIPLSHIWETWEWAKEHREYSDVLKHPNTGCMYDDHDKRGEWVIGKASSKKPGIDASQFPCNNAGSGCNDYQLDFSAPPTCLCSTPRKSDAPEDSCKNWVVSYPNAIPTDPGFVANKMPLVPGCTATPLQVKFDQIKHYSGQVNCGNLFLQSDVQSQPIVVFPQAEDDSFYALLMVDPDADLPNNGSWPDETKPGSHAPVRHWVIGNLNKSMLTTGDFTGASTVTEFKGPAPPYGSHRYGYYLFKQTGKIEFHAISDGRTNWYYGSFIDEHNLGFPVAQNWCVIQHTDDDLYFAN